MDWFITKRKRTCVEPIIIIDKKMMIVTPGKATTPDNKTTYNSMTVSYESNNMTNHENNDIN